MCGRVERCDVDGVSGCGRVRAIIAVLGNASLAPGMPRDLLMDSHRTIPGWWSTSFPGRQEDNEYYHVTGKTQPGRKQDCDEVASFYQGYVQSNSINLSSMQRFYVLTSCQLENKYYHCCLTTMNIIIYRIPITQIALALRDASIC